MKSITSTKARANFFSLIDDVNANHQPAFITGKRGNAVLVSEQDWQAITETLFLSAIPGMADSIIKGMSEPLEECADSVDWA